MKAKEENTRRTFFAQWSWRRFLGALLLAFAPVWYFFIAGVFARIPSDFSYSSDIISHDNFYDAEQGRFSGEFRSVTTFSYRAVGKSGDALKIENEFDARSVTGDPIFSVVREYGIDPSTGRHVGTAGDRIRNGYLFAPRMSGALAEVPDRSSFTYWHVNYDTPIQMEFQDEEILFNTRVYRYGAIFTADQTHELTDLPGVGRNLGVNLDAGITVWIEPATGYLVKYSDQATAYYYDLSTGERLYPWNRFRNFFADASVAQHAFEAKKLKYTFIFTAAIIPVLFAILGALLLFWRPILTLFGMGDASGQLKGAGQWFFPSVIFIFVISASFIGRALIFGLIDDSRSAEFQADIENINNLISDRLEIYTNALYGGRALFDASENVTREEWRAYTDGLRIRQNYPGIQGYGYSIWLEPSELESHIQSVRNEGYPKYTVHPEGDRTEYTAIVFLEPLDVRNQQAFGFDMYQEPTRREGMSRARDTGDAALSGRVTLVQEIDEDVQAGFLIYVPVYEKGAVLNSAEDRRRALLGFVYSPFRMNDFMERVVPPGSENVAIEVFDGASDEQLDEDVLMYRSSEIQESPYSISKTIDFGGHRWIVRYHAEAGYGSDFLRDLPSRALPVAGLFVAFLLSFIVYSANSRQRAAVQLAESMTEDLRTRTEENERIRDRLEKTNGELKKKARLLAKNVKEIETVNKYMVDRELKMMELKKQVEAMRKRKDTGV